jgi:general secretion pathway protein I
MISLAILAGGLTLLIAASAANVHSTHRAQMLGTATDLARAKMFDLEEELLQEGFQEMAETMDGDFADEKWPGFEWKATIEKVELPGLATAQAAGAAAGESGQDGAGAFGGALGLAGLGMAGLGGSGGEAGAGMDPASAMGAGLIGSQYEMIASVLEMSIRKVTLTVSWKVGHDAEELTVVCYFTDPAAVDTALSGGIPGADDGTGEAEDSGAPTPSRSSGIRGGGGRGR